MPSSTTFSLAGFVRFGNDVQARAIALIAEVDERVGNAEDRLNRAKAEAVAYLDSLDVKRMEAYERSAKPFLQLYATLGRRIPGNAPSRCQGERFLKSAPSAPNFTASVGLRNRKWAILGGLSSGAIIGLVAHVLMTRLNVEPFMLAAVGIALFSGILLSMMASYKVAERNYSAARKYAEEVTAFEESVEVFNGQAKAIILMSQEAGVVIEALSSNTGVVVEQLTAVVRDSINAASLLRKILEMPILDGEGALLNGVIEQLNERKGDVDELSLQLSGAAVLLPNVTEKQSDIDEVSLLLADRL